MSQKKKNRNLHYLSKKSPVKTTLRLVFCKQNYNLQSCLHFMQCILLILCKESHFWLFLNIFCTMDSIISLVSYGAGVRIFKSKCSLSSSHHNVCSESPCVPCPLKIQSPCSKKKKKRRKKEDFAVFHFHAPQQLSILWLSCKININTQKLEGEIQKTVYRVAAR